MRLGAGVVAPFEVFGSKMPLQRMNLIVWAVVYLIGVAYLLLLPPWEGYDEIAHYSYIQQLGDTGELPGFETGRLSLDVEQYLARAPAPYSTTPPFDDNGGLTYRKWFNAAHDLKLPHASPKQPRFFRPGERGNWQAQHPWMYYVLLAPVLELTSGASWAAQLFALRLASWTLAFSGFALALATTGLAVRSFYPVLQKRFQQLAIIWPLVLPGFFPEFARIGNDALVLLLLSMIWFMSIRLLIFAQSWSVYAGIGLLLGLGGLVKVTFLPVTASLLLWLLGLGLCERSAQRRYQVFGGLFLCLLIFTACVGNWYLENLLNRGSVTGLVELSIDTPRWLSAFSHPYEIIKGLLGIAITFVWGGTASSAYPPVVLVLPLLVPLAVFAGGSYWLLSERRPELAMLAIAMIISVLAGLVFYLLVRIAATGVGAGAPGWYLHVLVGPLSLLLAAGWQRFAERLPALTKVLVLVWVVYATCFAFAMTWLQVALFTGCTFKTADSRIYTAEGWMCLLKLGDLYGRLDLLAYPAAGLACFCLAVAIGFLCAYLWFHRLFVSGSK